MVCPSCNGSERRAIAPGFWECTSTITDEVRVGDEWQPAGPGGQMVPVAPRFEQTERPCGHRYQDAAGVSEEGQYASGPQTCGLCTVFAIGLCAECRQPICGDHLAREADQAFCLGCVGRRKKQRVAEVSQRAAERSIKWERARKQTFENVLRVIPAFLDAMVEAGSPEAISVCCSVERPMAGLRRSFGLDSFRETKLFEAWMLDSYTKRVYGMPRDDSGVDRTVAFLVGPRGKWYELGLVKSDKAYSAEREPRSFTPTYGHPQPSAVNWSTVTKSIQRLNEKYGLGLEI